MKALVIGAGVCGPVTAMALQRAGIDPVVYDAHRPTTDDVGSYLTVATNGLDALSAIDADGPVRKAGFADLPHGDVQRHGQAAGHRPDRLHPEPAGRQPHDQARAPSPRAARGGDPPRAFQSHTASA